VDDSGVAMPAPPRPRLGDESDPAGEEVAEVETSGVPKYRTLERKDARLRADQIADLTTLARRLSGQRRNRDERITDNTLIRVAVDLLLEHGDQLRGDNESELRESVSSGVRGT